jgi:hypothetical protein
MRRLQLTPEFIATLERLTTLPLQHVLEGFRGVDEDGPFAIADDELMHGLVAMDLPLPRPQAAEEGLQIIVGAVAFGPGVTGEEARPAVAEGGTDMGNHHRRIFSMALGMLFQLGQKVFDLPLDAARSWARLTFFVGGVKASLQLDQPPALAFELPILSRKSLAVVHHGQQLLQERMAPFFRLRRSEASRRARSSNTRRPPRAKGGLLPSVSVERIKSA